VAIIDPDGAPRPTAGAGGLVVWDPHGAATARLEARGVAFTPVDGPDALPKDFRCLLIGKDALTPRLATDARWHALAAEGKRLLVLDQAHPLHYQAVPADFEVTDYEGRVAFAENLEHPAFAGLAQEDFFCWSGDHVVYRNVYKKSSRGARSLAQCDDELSCSAVAECTVGEGLMVLSQMVVCEKLAADPVARRLFDNLVGYALGYELVRNTTAVAIDPEDPRGKMLAASGLEYRAAADPLAAVRDKANDIVVADASPQALAALAEATSDVLAFAERGGWLMLWNVGPKGLPDFNRLVGCDHLLRPFRCEKVSLSPLGDPLASGLSQRDVSLSSGQRIFGWQGDEFAADDVFTHIVSLENIAPFMTGPGIEGTSADRPDSIVNGFTGTEAWKYIRYYPMNEDGSPQTPTWTLPREETLTGLSIVPNDHYWLMTKVKLVFNGDESTAQTIDLAPYEKGSNPRQDFTLKPVKARTVTFVPLEWKEAAERAILGIDNLWLRVERPQGWRDRVRPLLNVGGLVKYPRGKGGILLNQVNVKASEAVPVNAQKKQAIVSTLLRNLHAVFAGRRTLLPGEGLRYHPVSLEGRCNLYLTAAEGWPDKEHDLSHLPLGEQKFAGVTYRIRDFKTSPLESAVTLGGMRGVKAPREVTGLEVGRKADVLFFLHTFVRKNEWQPRREGDEPPVIFQYVVHYADGKSETVDVQYGKGAAHWLRPAPRGLRDAAVAWAAPFPDDDRHQAVLYQFQWNNPRPEVAVKAVDLRYHPKVGNRWGTPVLLALTAAEAME
jgi:beta-galactosidase